MAIKFLLPGALGNREAVERFAREARAAAKIKSEHIARVKDVGALENGAPYMVMECLVGSDLAAWLRESGPLTIEQAVSFVLQACEALAEAHSLGIVHRDLKPANLFCVRGNDGRPCIKVLDFGISKIGTDLSMTKTQAVVGSPLYMSPEQISSAKSVDARGDIWSLGATLFELVTGQLPFEAATLPELVYKIMNVPPLSLRDLRPGAPVALERVVLRCLERDRAARFQSVGELSAALGHIEPDLFSSSVKRVSRISTALGSGPSLPSLSPSQPNYSTLAIAETAASWSENTSVPPRGRRRLAALLGGGALALLTLLAVLAAFPWTRHAPSPALSGAASLATGSAAVPSVLASASEPVPASATPLPASAGPAPVVSARRRTEDARPRSTASTSRPVEPPPAAPTPTPGAVVDKPPF